jgi:3-oxoacyl-[acyl-carrier-protein] synthase II
MADCQPGDVSHVSAEGRGLPQNDAIEASAIRETLGDVPVTAIKSFYGDTGAGCGSLEIVAAVMSILNDQVPQTLNYETPDPACPVNVVQGAPLSAVQQNVLTLNQNQRGQTAALLLSKP